MGQLQNGASGTVSKHLGQNFGIKKCSTFTRQSKITWYKDTFSIADHIYADPDPTLFTCTRGSCLVSIADPNKNVVFKNLKIPWWKLLLLLLPERIWLLVVEMFHHVTLKVFLQEGDYKTIQQQQKPMDKFAKWFYEKLITFPHFKRNKLTFISVVYWIIFFYDQQ